MFPRSTFQSSGSSSPPRPSTRGRTWRWSTPWRGL